MKAIRQHLHNFNSELQKQTPRLLLSLLCSLPMSSIADLDPVTTHKQQLAQLSNRIASLQQRIDNANDKHETLLEELSKTETQISFLNVSLSEIGEKLKNLPNTIVSLQNRIKSNEAILEKQQAILAKQLRAAYMAGQRDFLKLLLQEENPEHVSRLMEYYKAINGARATLLTDIEKKSGQLKQDHDTYQKQVGHLESLKTSQLNQKKTLQASKSYRQVVIKEINNELSSHQKELDQLQKNKQALSKVITTLEKTHRWDRQSTRPFYAMKGRLLKPLTGKISKQFGETILDSKLMSNGLFIKSNSGKKVKSIYAGNVVFADWLRGFGLVLIVDHGDGYMSLYAHNESLFKHAGDIVKGGEIIASVGHTGGQSQPGLYFEIRHNGKPINPNEWLNSLV